MHGIRTKRQGKPVRLALVSRRAALVLLLADLATVTASLLLAIWVRYLWDRTFPWEVYLPLWPAVALFPFAYALGLLISPLLLVIVLLIKLDSPGPGLYRHTRIGQGGGGLRPGNSA